MMASFAWIWVVPDDMDEADNGAFGASIAIQTSLYQIFQQNACECEYNMASRDLCYNAGHGFPFT
jgi:hypothetical protein